MKDSTKRTLVNLVVALIFVMLGIAIGGLIENTRLTKNYNSSSVVDTILVEEVELTLDDHIEMIVPDKLQNVCKAIIFVESRGIDTACRANGDCMGILQITPIYVKECNRLQDSVTYTLEDRTDIVKSLEMFVIIQNYHNPKHDVDKAIHLHNPTAGPDYKRKVKTKLNTIY